MALTQIGKGGLGSTIGIGTNSPDRSLHVAGTEPSIVFEKTDESTDLKTFRIFMNSSSLQIGTVDDAFSAGVTAIEITRDNTDAITGINVRSEGGATTTSLQQGIAKAWGDCTHEAVITDSLNLSGGVDNGVGDYTYSFTNNMSAANYSIPVNVGYASLISFDNNEQASSSYNLRLFTRADSLTAADATNHSTLHGDLA